MDEQDLLSRIDASTAAHRADILADLAALIAIPSVQGEAAPGAPFGPAVLMLYTAGDAHALVRDAPAGLPEKGGVTLSRTGEPWWWTTCWSTITVPSGRRPSWPCRNGCWPAPTAPLWASPPLTASSRP